MRFMDGWSQQDYDNADEEMIEEILEVMTEEYERNRPPGADEDGDYEE